MNKLIINRVSNTFLICTLVFLAGCELEDSEFEKQAKIEDVKIQQYLTSHEVTASKHTTGFYFDTLVSNPQGAALEEDDVVEFYYKMSLLDGTLVDETVKYTDEPVRCKLLNYSIVPQALDYGINLMKKGEKFRFYIPSYLAYGDYQHNLFAARSIFIIDVEVTNVLSETAINEAQLNSIDAYVKANYSTFDKFASGLYYIQTALGTGNKPSSYDLVKFHFTRKYLDGTLIKTTIGGNPVSYYLNRGNMVQGLEEGLKQMREGGKATLIMPSSIAFKQSLCLVPEKIRKDVVEDEAIHSEVKPYSIVTYEVELIKVN